MQKISKFLVKKHQQAILTPKKLYEDLLNGPVNYKNITIDIYDRKERTRNIEYLKRMNEEQYTFLFEYLINLLDEVDFIKIHKINYYNSGGNYGGFNFTSKDSKRFFIYYGGIKDYWYLAIPGNNYNEKTKEDHQIIIDKINEYLSE